MLNPGIFQEGPHTGVPRIGRAWTWKCCSETQSVCGSMLQTVAPICLHYVYFLLHMGLSDLRWDLKSTRKRGAQFWEEQSDGESN